MRRSTTAALLAAALASALLASCTTTPDGPTRQAVVVDTDMGFDDVRALMLLAANDEVEIVAVTVSGTGLATCPTGAENARALLQALDHPEVPVACGPQDPLAGNNTAPAVFRRGADALAGMNLPPPDALHDDAVELLISSIATRDHTVLLALGPLTNVALAFDQQPSLPGQLDHIVMMGGALDTPGNVVVDGEVTAAEFNIWFDPLAAQQVFEAEVDITMVPLDATNDVPLTPSFGIAFSATGAGPAVELLRGYNRANLVYPETYHWDDLAAAVLLAPSVVDVEQRTVTVTSDGQTIDDPDGASVSVAVGADQTAFSELFYGAFGVTPPGG